MSNMQISGIASSYNATPNNYYDVPTNPKLTLGSYATGDKLFTIIYEDGSITNDTIERPVSSEIYMKSIQIYIILMDSLLDVLIMLQTPELICQVLI